ncbi:DUF4097 family beta strand repeat-containing protein [Antribacter gilvus]|uniref:DUF4097 family beta strand repeat-containing protein n=1 Tax=Antribacter gilvus TaxID=2304675 RepID=UPI000F78B159|nr:DUF4097 family beta strand repeat-containing protein [Antribacter gilvus]
MPVYETPEVLSVVLDLGVGDVRITASDRTGTVVDVSPSNASDESDVKAAQQVSVECADGVLRVTGPKVPALDFSKKSRSVALSIQLPSGAQVGATLQMGDVHVVGRLGECRLKTSAGNLQVERTGALHLDTSAGHITVGGVIGDVEISTGSGKVRVGEVEGAASVRNANGATTIDVVTGDLRVRSANGDISVERVGSDVDVKTSNGAVRVGEVVRGVAVLESGLGDLEVGIAEGAAAWLDVKTGFGHVDNQLEETAGPDGAGRTVEVRGRTSYGDIAVRRA